MANNLCRMDYCGDRAEYIGTTAEFPTISDLPTENVSNGSTFLWVDTQEIAMFYKGTWYSMNNGG